MVLLHYSYFLSWNILRSRETGNFYSVISTLRLCFVYSTNTNPSISIASLIIYTTTLYYYYLFTIAMIIILLLLTITRLISLSQVCCIPTLSLSPTKLSILQWSQLFLASTQVLKYALARIRETSGIIRLLATNGLSASPFTAFLIFILLGPSK